MAIEDIWFGVDYKLPPRAGKYIVKDAYGCDYICYFSSKGQWIEEVPMVGHFVRANITAWRYIDYE